jgi:hypothetical protein
MQSSDGSGGKPLSNREEGFQVELALGWLQVYWLEAFMGLLVTQCLLLLCCIGIMVRLSRQKQTLEKLIQPAQELSLRKILASESIDEAELLGYLYHLDESARTLKGQVGLVRYNAVGERASDMSFSLALLDAHKSGVVLSSLFNPQGQSYIYAKPVEKGISTYRLSKEEEQAIQQAIQNRVATETEA